MILTDLQYSIIDQYYKYFEQSKEYCDVADLLTLNITDGDNLYGAQQKCLAQLSMLELLIKDGILPLIKCRKLKLPLFDIDGNTFGYRGAALVYNSSGRFYLTDSKNIGNNYASLLKLDSTHWLPLLKPNETLNIGDYFDKH